MSRNYPAYQHESQSGRFVAHMLTKDRHLKTQEPTQ